MHKTNFISFPSNSPGKAHAVFKLHLGMRSQLKKKTEYGQEQVKRLALSIAVGLAQV